MSNQKIKILHLEDSETDAAHIHRALKKGELNFTAHVVDSRQDYLKELHEFIPDVVISDHSMPSFNSVEALDILRTYGLDIPFILVTGAVSEEFAAQIMLKGADDYVLKDRPQRLPAAVLNALEKYNARREREKSDQLLRNIFDRSLDVLCSIDLAGRFIEVSSAAEKIWGYKTAELIGKEYMSLVYHEDHAITFQAAENIMTGVSYTNFENRYVHKTGTLIPMIWSAQWDNEAKIMYCVARDGTERMNAEKAITAERKRLFDLFMNAPFSNCLLKGTDHVFELVNNTSSKLMPHNVIGKKFKDAFPEFEQQGLVNVLDNVYLKGEDFEAKELLVKMDQNKDGALVDKYLNMQLTPYRDAAGNVEGVYYFGVHVTEQVLARNKLEESFEKLKSAESLQSSILNSLPAQVALLDHEGKIVAVNQAWKDFGQVNNLNSKNHSVGDNYIKVSGKAIGPDKKSGKEIAKGIVDVINGNNSEFSLEYRCDSAEEKRWFIVRVSPAHSQKDRGAVVMHTNITERKLAEEKIRKSEANLSALIENTDAFVYSLDTNFCYVTFNKRLSRSIRASAGLDIKIGDNVFAFLKNSDPDAAQMWKNRYTEALSGKFLQFEMDYSQAGIPRFFNFFISPIKEGGNVIGLSCFARDITEKKIAENELKRLHKRLLLATRSANMGIWDWDITNDHLSWDDGMFKLYEIEGMKFRSAYDAWLQRLHPEDKEKVNEDIQAAIAGKKEYDTEFRIICNNSAIRYIKATGLVERDAAGNAVRMIGANWDITASKLAEMEVIELNENLEKRILERTSELAEANKALEAFSYSVSHDLRSPVRSIVGFTQIIKDEFENSFGPELKELFGYIHNSGKRMDTIITDLLNLAKLDKAPLNITSINLNDLVSKVWIQLRSAAVHEVEFVVDTFPQVRGDASTIEQVLINMLGNAIKYSSKKKNPLITMGYEEKEDVIVFYIRDNGAGFDMKDYGRLFGAFQRLHGDSEFEGTGIGLLLVKRIIEKHGGAIWAEGKIEEGATFYFSLPAEKTRA